jgi:hypothetical protein
MKIWKKGETKPKYLKNLSKNKAITFAIIAVFIANLFTISINTTGENSELSSTTTEKINSTAEGKIAPLGDSPWWNTGWMYRKQITINHVMVQNDLINFPVLINLPYDNDLKLHAQTDGDDLVFTDTAGNKLAHEIEAYNNSFSQLTAWVKIPSLSSTIDTMIYLYYGNALCSNQQNLLGTWDNNFLMIQHLNETYSTTTDHFKDSTSHAHDGTLVGGNGLNIVDGKIGKALNFNGATTKLTLVDSPDFTTPNSATRTYEAWVKLTVSPSGYWGIIGDGNGPCFQFYGNQLDYMAGPEYKSSALGWTTGTWYYVVCTVDGLTKIEWFRNGTSVGTVTGYFLSNKDPSFFGIGADQYGEYFNGVIDEVRMSSTVRSPGWIQTSYNNQNSPGSFHNIGNEETYGPQQHYTITITIVGSGSITKNPDQTTYNAGQVVTLTANPFIGWSFDHWSGNLSGNANPTTIIMNENKTVTANFTQNQYTLTITIQGQGTVTKNPDQPWYTYDQSITLIANPVSDWAFDHWSGDLTGNTNSTMIIINGNKAVTAAFTPTSGYSLTVTYQGSGTVTKNPDQTWYVNDQIVTLVANPTTGWTFNHWDGNLSGNINPTTITMNNNKTVIVNFTQIQYMLTITIKGQGQIIKNPEQPWYTYNQNVTLTAKPAAGWNFNHWDDSLTGNANPTTITMNNNKAVTATFFEQTGGGAQNYTFFAPLYADSGSGLAEDPYINCLKNAFTNMTQYDKGAIYFPTGYYVETHNIILNGSIQKPKHLHLYGDGFWNSLIKIANNFDNSLIIVQNKDSVYIDGLQIDGNKDHQNVAKPLIDLQYSYDYTIQNTFITNSKGHGIQIGDATHQTWSGDIINCPIEYCNGNAINITNSANLIIESCTLAHNYGYNINICNDAPHVIDNYIESEFHDSIRFGPYSSGLIENNYIRDATKTYNAFVFDSAMTNSPQELIIRGNQINGNVGLKHISGIYRNLVIEGNTFPCNTPVDLPFSMKSGYIINNVGLNPIGKYAYPFYENTISLGSSSQTNPSANQEYTVQIASCRIISSGGTGVNINVYDGHGNLIKNEGTTCDVYMEVGWVINFGGFSIAPTVQVFFG